MVGEHWIYNIMVRVVFGPASAIFISSCFRRCHRDIANLPEYFGHAWPTPSKIIVSTCKRLSCFSACKTSTSQPNSFLRYSKNTTYLLFWVLSHAWACPLKLIASMYRKLWCSPAQKFNFIPRFFLEISQKT